MGRAVSAILKEKTSMASIFRGDENILEYVKSFQPVFEIKRTLDPQDQFFDQYWYYDSKKYNFFCGRKGGKEIFKSKFTNQLGRKSTDAVSTTF